MARAKYDPLEAAKIGADGEKPKAPTPTFKNKDLDVSDVAVAVVEAPRAKVPAHRPHPKYTVTEPGRVSIDGQICTISKGTILDSAGYGGDAGIERLRGMGLKLEMVQD